MMIRNELTREQALYAIKHGELESSVLTSSDVVIVLMTQDWCPQWRDMSRWVYGLETSTDIQIYTLIYNKVDYSTDFMGFKENVWCNDQIPYIRFYKAGRLVKETNYIPEAQFKKLLNSL